MCIIHFMQVKTTPNNTLALLSSYTYQSQIIGIEDFNVIWLSKQFYIVKLQVKQRDLLHIGQTKQTRIGLPTI